MNFGWKGITKLIHYTIEKRTVIHKPEIEEMSTEEKYVEEPESSSPSATSNTEQISEDLRPAEQPSLKEVASIKDDTLNKHQLSSSNISTQVNNDNYILNVLNELPEQWIGSDK